MACDYMAVRSFWVYARVTAYEVMGSIVSGLALVLAVGGFFAALLLSFPQTPTWRYRVDSWCIVMAVIVFWFLISSLVSFAGARLFNRGRRVLITHRQKGSSTTTPPKVIYLRPFRDDRKSQRTPFVFFALRSFKTYEEQIARAFERIGQVRAARVPGEGLAPLGSERVPFPDEAWQREVTAWIRQARLILIRASLGPGVVWEVGQALSLGRADSMLLLVPDDRAEYREFVLATKHLFPAALPAWDDDTKRVFVNTIGIVRFDAERAPTLVRLRFPSFSLAPLERALRRAISITPALRELQELTAPPLWKRAGRAARISVAALLTLCVALALYLRVTPALESLNLYATSFHLFSDGRLGPFITSLPPEFASGLRSALDQNPSARRFLESSEVPDVEFTYKSVSGIQNLTETDLLVLAGALRGILTGGQQPCGEALRAMLSAPGGSASFFELLTHSPGAGAYAPILLRATMLADQPLTLPSPRGEGDSKALILAIGQDDACRFILIMDSDPNSITDEDACWFQQTWLRVLPTLTPATRRAQFLRLYFLSFFPPRWMHRVSHYSRC